MPEHQPAGIIAIDHPRIAQRADRLLTQACPQARLAQHLAATA